MGNLLENLKNLLQRINSLKDILEGLLKNRIKCLHDDKELKEILMGVMK